jgi:hypothetical protein
MTNSFARSPAAAMGALLAVATISLHLLLSKTQSEQFAAVLLAACGAIYIGFSLQKGNLAQIATELTVATGFIAPHWWVFGYSVDCSGCLGGAWNLGLCAPPEFKARVHTLKARRHTLMVAHFAPSPTGWWWRPWRLCGACVSK